MTVLFGRSVVLCLSVSGRLKGAKIDVIKVKRELCVIVTMALIVIDRQLCPYDFPHRTSDHIVY